MRYGIKVLPKDGGFEVTCRDIPECVYDADTEKEALDWASQMLPGTLVLFYRKKQLPFPLPSELRKGEVGISVPARIQAKMLFWNFMKSKGLKISDVAKKLGVSHSEASRLVDLTRDSASIDTVEEALKKLGGSLDLSVKE